MATSVAPSHGPRTRPLERRDLAVYGLVLLAAGAWLALWLGGDRLHGGHGAHAAAPGLLGFVAAWTLMSVAMMLPTTLPLVAVFRQVVARRRNRATLALLLAGGYVAVWSAAGVAAYAITTGWGALAAQSAWLQGLAGFGQAGLLLTAGAFQFSSLKYRCLDRCRSPAGLVMAHWRGGREALRSFHLGVLHGLYCVGCCWALMLLMLAASANSLAWMMGLGAVMAIEKNTPWGRAFVAPVGVLLIAWGGVLIAIR